MVRWLVVWVGILLVGAALLFASALVGSVLGMLGAGIVVVLGILMTAMNIAFVMQAYGDGEAVRW